MPLKSWLGINKILVGICSGICICRLALINHCFQIELVLVMSFFWKDETRKPPSEKSLEQG